MARVVMSRPDCNLEEICTAISSFYRIEWAGSNGIVERAILDNKFPRRFSRIETLSISYELHSALSTAKERSQGYNKP